MNKNDISGLVNLGGFFTTQIYLQGQTLAEIECRVGFDSGRLSLGAWFAAAIQLPGPDDFELAGYSQVAGHLTKKQYGNINSPANDSEKEAYLRRKKMAIAEWQLHGSHRLIKIIPMLGPIAYPIGSGIPQWKIVQPVLCQGICFVKDYPNGKFIPDQY